MALASIQYAQDYDERLVLNGANINGVDSQWQVLLQPYLKSTQICICPSDSTPYTDWGMKSSYTLNSVYQGNTEELKTAGVKLSAIEDSAGTVQFGDGGNADGGSGSYWQAFDARDLAVSISSTPHKITTGQGDFIGRHFDGCNMAFLDGHVKWLKVSTLAKTSGTISFIPDASATPVTVTRYPYFTTYQD